MRSRSAELGFCVIYHLIDNRRSRLILVTIRTETSALAPSTKHIVDRDFRVGHVVVGKRADVALVGLRPGTPTSAGRTIVPLAVIAMVPLATIIVGVPLVSID